MKRSSIIFFFLLFSSLSAFAQNTLSGSLTDKSDNSPLIGASAVLLFPSDSSIYKGASADVNGRYNIENVKAGKYILKITYIGYNDHFRDLQMPATSLNLENIAMQSSSRLLKDVLIEEKATTAVQKGDTTQYNANSYKTNPDANAEDLITKMSGITTTNGKIQAHGEDVKKVLVDGKPFFGDDPNAVLKNLPAEVIDKIQVFDQQSDQSKFTGVNDGNTSKAINIITKPGMKNGTFGKAYAGYGYDNVYKAGLNLNFFKGDRRLSIVSQSNNINEQNFSSEDLAGVMSSGQGGGGRGMQGGGPGGPGGGNWGGGNNSSNFLVNAKNGISTTHAFGINYSDKWAKKLELSASYFLNSSDNKAVQFTNRQYLLASDSGQVYKENNVNSSINTNHRFNMRLEWKLDTNNSVTITPKLSLQQNSGKSELSGTNSIQDDTLNNTNSLFNSETNAFNFSNDILLQHKFSKQGRTISLNLSTALNTTDANSDLHSMNNYYNDSSFISNLFDQESTLIKKGSTLGANLTYTEPAGKKGIVQISYSNSFNQTDNDKKTYNYSAVNDDYNDLDSSLSNVFKSNYTTHKAGLGYRVNAAKLMMMVGVNYQYAVLSADQSFPSTYKLERQFNNILPNGMLRYNFSAKKTLRIFYRSSTTQPAIDQLQNVLNNTNPTQLSIGNPDLKQNYDNSVFVRYGSSNTEKGTSFFAMISGTYTMDYIANSTYTATKDTVRNGILLLRGTQITKPVNVDGYTSMRSFITYGFPFSQIKSNLNINANAAFIKTPGFVNDKINYSNSQTYGGGISVSSNFSTKIDFSLSTNLTYNIVENTISKKLNSQYYNQNSKAKINLIFLKSIVLTSELTHQYYKGLSEGYNQNYLLWNAGLGYKFLKDQKAEIRLTVNDILEQNTSITRNTTETYIEDVQTNLLQRYFMLTFSYNIRYFKKPAENNPDKKAK
ncbi:MAG: hypothetical protein K0Q95_1445 [Bacteroidota bacterium]|jgi:hypothetical protein|nr:hypothetical protein [Bacteroidota bacterium]